MAENAHILEEAYTLRKTEQRVNVETVRGSLSVNVRFDRAQGRHHQSTGNRCGSSVVSLVG